jgi:predicted Zn-dependent peptidase
MDGILGGGAASRLFLIVREEKGFTYDAHSEYVRRVNGSDWSAVTEVRTEVTKPALEEVLKQVERMRREKVTDKELAAAKSFATGVFTLQVERAASLADMLADQKLYDLPADELETYVSRINAVTADEVLKASQAVCDTSRAAVVVVGDGAKLKGDLGSFGKIVAFDTEGKPKSVAP